ncbi:MAG: TetR/AcrR family transcriptional regulator [Pyrinomonadaceae bacterium]|nr:TetR/AcrR family transcriptional regulator [Pyrinomonadaceae bacterium]
MRATVQTKEIRDAILDATDKLLARFGYQKMTIDDLAAEVGIGKGSIYLHFKSKEEIALSHVDRIIDRLCDRLEMIASSDKSPDKKIRLMTLERVSFRFDSVQHYSESINELLSSLRSKLLAHRREHHEREASIFESVIKEGQKQGVFEKGRSSEKAQAFITATNALLPFGLSTQELGARHEIEGKALAVAKLMLRGVSA